MPGEFSDAQRRVLTGQGGKEIRFAGAEKSLHFCLGFFKWLWRKEQDRLQRGWGRVQGDTCVFNLEAALLSPFHRPLRSPVSAVAPGSSLGHPAHMSSTRPWCV